jgi:hypothetical protein
MTKKPLTEAYKQLVKPKRTKLAKKAGAQDPTEPVASEDPRAELRRLVDMHRRFTNTARQLEQMRKDIRWRDGTVKPCILPEHTKQDLEDCGKQIKGEAGSLEKAMLVQLRKQPIYIHFLSKVYGIGPVVAAYIVAMVKIDKCPNVSNLIRYCGNACGPDGKRETRTKGSAPKAIGGTGTYNPLMRTVVWQGMTAGFKNSYKFTCCTKHDEARPKKGASQAVKTEFLHVCHACRACQATESPFGTTNKYLRRWSEAWTGRLSEGRELGAFNAARRKATDLFLWDLYVVWRTLEGMTVRPDKFSVVRGRYHNGEEARDTLYTLTLEEALELVGQVEGTPATAWAWPEKDEEKEVERAAE